MIRDTEDVVARVNRRIDLLEQGDPRAATWVADFREILTERQSLSDRIDELESAIGKARIQINGGLCYFSAEAKHAQLADADRTLADALGEKSLTDAAKTRAALHQEGIAP